MDIFSLISEKMDVDLNIHRTLIELEELNKTWVIKGIPAEEHSYGRVPGEEDIMLWQIPRNSMKMITMLAILSNSKNILDLGTSAGYSSIWLSIAARINTGHIWSVEIFSPKIELSEKFIKKANVKEFITTHHGDIAEFLRNWDKNKKVDFILLDADKENHLKYIEMCHGILIQGGIIIVDNASNYRCILSEMTDFFEKSLDYITYLMDFDNGLLLCVKKKIINII